MTVGEVLRRANDHLTAKGSDTPRLDADLLLGLALGLTRTELATHQAERLPPSVQERFDELLARREAGEPVAYILGRRHFADIELLVDPRVLIPRPDTETLYEQAVAYAPVGGRVHEVGTGSGAVALALAKARPDLTVSASDLSAGAVEVAQTNAVRLGLDVEITVADGLPRGDYDLVVANLPYVREDEWDGLAREICDWEPRQALVAGVDGLDAIRALVRAAPAGLLLALEHAPAQAAAVRALLTDARTERDLAGRERVTIGTVP
jgi:release factor glutamine methyltransferase